MIFKAIDNEAGIAADRDGRAHVIDSGVICRFETNDFVWHEGEFELTLRWVSGDTGRRLSVVVD